MRHTLLLVGDKSLAAQVASLLLCDSAPVRTRVLRYGARSLPVFSHKVLPGDMLKFKTFQYNHQVWRLTILPFEEPKQERKADHDIWMMGMTLLLEDPQTTHVLLVNKHDCKVTHQNSKIQWFHFSRHSFVANLTPPSSSYCVPTLSVPIDKRQALGNQLYALVAKYTSQLEQKHTHPQKESWTSLDCWLTEAREGLVRWDGDPDAYDDADADALDSAFAGSLAYLNGKLTGMMLELDSSRVSELLWDHGLLRETIRDCCDVLRQTKEEEKHQQDELETLTQLEETFRREEVKEVFEFDFEFDSEKRSEERLSQWQRNFIQRDSLLNALSTRSKTKTSLSCFVPSEVQKWLGREWIMKELDHLLDDLQDWYQFSFDLRQRLRSVVTIWKCIGETDNAEATRDEALSAAIGRCRDSTIGIVAIEWLLVHLEEAETCLNSLFQE